MARHQKKKKTVDILLHGYIRTTTAKIKGIIHQKHKQVAQYIKKLIHVKTIFSSHISKSATHD
jgi:hypothetical protein